MPTRHPTRRWAAARLVAAAAAAGLALAPGWGTAGPVGAPAAEGEDASAAVAAAATRAASITLPAEHQKALKGAWSKIRTLADQVERGSVVRGFGQRARAIVEEALNEAGASGPEADSLEQVVDAPLHLLFLQQLQTLTARAADKYEEEVAARPNAFDGMAAAEEAFLNSALDLVRPGSDWSFEAARQDLLDFVRRSYDRDSQLIEVQAKQGDSKQIALKVIRKLQEQQEAVFREAESRGAFPWNVRWQYFLDNSPLGFRGQYAQGRSVVELLLMPSPDPRYKDNILNRIGPVNVALAFDMLM